MSLKDKIKQSALAATIAAAPLAHAAAESAPQEKAPDKYKTAITLQNDSTAMVGSTKAFYSASNNQIYLKKGDASWSDFGFGNAPQEMDESLAIVHEREHQIDLEQKRIGTANMSLNEDYQRNVHLEIGALIAEKLEIRRQYQTAATPSEKAKILNKFAANPGHADYIAAIKSGQINPDSKSSRDFAAEMAFIKESATRYRADPSDSGYRTQWESLSKAYLSRVGANAVSNPQALQQEVRAIYQIGGIDFTQYGAHKDIVLENQSIAAAGNMLAKGAGPHKLIAFMNEGEGPFKLAETLDVTGLSRAQAEQVLQTAIVSQEVSENVAADLCLGQTPEYDFDFIAQNLREKTAVYLDMKSDIWEKENTLSEQGDPEKFARLMQQAKTVTLDPENWFKDMERHIRYGQVGGKEAVLQRLAAVKGKTVNLDKTIANIAQRKLPLDGTSKGEVLRQKAEKAKADADFAAEYNQQNPAKIRRSAPYQREIMDLASNMLKDELNARQKAEQEKKLQPLCQRPSPTSYTRADGGINIAIPGKSCQKAELKRFENEKGEVVDISLLDGKPHGPVMIMDKDGNIKDLKLYDQGKELAPAQNKIELKNEQAGGLTHAYALLNGQKFGTETVTAADGTAKAAFWSADGTPIYPSPTAEITQTQIPLRPAEESARQTAPGTAAFSFANAQFSYTPNLQETNAATSRDTLKAELKSQTGELRENPLSRAHSLRLDKHFEQHAGHSDTLSRKSPARANTPAKPALQPHSPTR